MKNIFLNSILLLILLFVNINIIYSQDYVNGELLVKLKPNTEINDFTNSFKNLKLSAKEVWKR